MSVEYFKNLIVGPMTIYASNGDIVTTGKVAAGNVYTGIVGDDANHYGGAFEDALNLVKICDGTWAINADGDVTLGAGDFVTSGDVKAATFHSGTDAGIDATVSYVDTILGAKTLTFKKGILISQV